MSTPELNLTSPSSLSQQLKSQTEQVLAKLIRTNYNTQFAQVARGLAGFRDTTSGGVDGMDDASLSNTFRDTAQLTTYDTYAPFFAKLREKPCKESAVANLLAPGLPVFFSGSSSTSGGIRKFFPRYDQIFESLEVKSLTPVPKCTIAHIFSFKCDSLDIGDEHGRLVKTVHVTNASSVAERLLLGLDPKVDEERMSRFIFDHAAPFAAGSRSLETMRMVFITTFVDMMRHLDAEFDMMVDCIANGTIPDLDGIEEFRHCFESNVLPDPERAEELRNVGRPSSRQGWCSQVWPNLRSITGTASGSFTSSIPLAQSFLGSNVKICPRGYGSAEAWVASPYSLHELNQLKPNCDNITEFLDISKADSINSLVQPWEVEAGKRYEPVLTTPNGLWRYRMGDMVEIAGFDPTDGTPIVRFIERRNVAIRCHMFLLTEEQLRSAMSSVAADTLGEIVEWTAILDDRQLFLTVGFFVELAGDESLIRDPTSVTRRMLGALSQYGHVSMAIGLKFLGKPTIRIVEPGTFSEFRQRKIDEGVHSLGQIKIPVVLPNATYVNWFSNRVIKEL